MAIQVLVPGRHNNHPIARRASRGRYGELLMAGIEVFEYQPGMNHTKLMIIDEVWAVIGSSNFDNRSFGLNDEVNALLTETEVAARLAQDFKTDLQNSRKIDLALWQSRSWGARLLALAGIVLERQQ